MLFNVSHKVQEKIEQFLISASTISNVLVYCDSQNISPLSIVEQSQNLIVVQPSQSFCFLVNIQGQNGESLSYAIFDTFANTISWINSQTGKTLQSLNRFNKNLVVA